MKHTSHLGKIVDMEELRRKHEHTIATGNMGVNARGDELGPGGKITETVQRRAKKHYKTTRTSNSKMSIKGNNIDETFEKETSIKSAKKPARKTTPKAKTTRTVETETASGDIHVSEVNITDED